MSKHFSLYIHPCFVSTAKREKDWKYIVIKGKFITQNKAIQWGKYSFFLIYPPLLETILKRRRCNICKLNGWACHSRVFAFRSMPRIKKTDAIFHTKDLGVMPELKVTFPQYHQTFLVFQRCLEIALERRPRNTF